MLSIIKFSIFFLGMYSLFFTIPQCLAQTEIIGRCGGSYMISVPPIIDMDSDLVDDKLEQLLLETFTPAFIRFDDDNCPGPDISGLPATDSNLVVCHIFLIPQQYAADEDLLSVRQFPVPLVADTSLSTGLVWYDNLIVIYGALLYGKDCGLTSHTADIEGFTVSLKYTGPDIEGGWRYDTVMNNWRGITIQTISHAGTLCEKIETGPYRSIDFPNGFDTIFASPDKHGNYLTISKCNSGFICDPSCNGTQIPKPIKVINAGELNAPLVTDLGIYYSDYAGEDPWTDLNFLESQGGSAGTIKSKLLKELEPEFMQGAIIDSCFKICDLYNGCFNCADSIYNQCVVSCDTAQPDSSGNVSPWYSCEAPPVYVIALPEVQEEIQIFPNPVSTELGIIFPERIGNYTIILSNSLGMELFKTISNETKSSIDLGKLNRGVFFLKIETKEVVLYKKILVMK